MGTESETISPVYVTKYVLSEGAIRVYSTGELSAKWPNMVTVPELHGLNGTMNFHGRDWHRTEEAARQQVETMRLARIKSIEKQLAKLRDLKVKTAAWPRKEK